jgi:hypothetical protein
MSRKVVEGFVPAQSNNMPKIDSWMVAQYLSNNECFNAPEMPGVKTTTKVKFCNIVFTYNDNEI